MNGRTPKLFYIAVVNKLSTPDDVLPNRLSTGKQI